MNGNGYIPFDTKLIFYWENLVSTAASSRGTERQTQEDT